MPNPFFFAGKITNPEHFVGREKELKKIFGYLDTSHSGQIQHASVVGERRIGKSSLLYHICHVYERYLPDHQKYRFVFIDLDNPHCHTQQGLLTYILEKLDILIPEQFSLETFYDLVEQQNRDDTWAVLLMDEFEHLSQRPDEFPDSFYDALRSLGNNNLAGIVTASQHNLQSLAADEKLTSPFFNIFHQINLVEFNEIEANALLNRGRVSDQPFTEDDCQKILKIAGRHPACLQVVAEKVYNAKSGGLRLDWKAIKGESLKEPPFSNRVVKTNWFVSPAKWLFWDSPRYLGNAILVFIGRGEHTNETTDRLIGYLAIIVVLGVLFKIIPWPLVTKYIRRLSELFFQ